VSATWFVKAADVFEDGNFNVSTGLPVAAPDQIGLAGFEGALDGGPRHWVWTNGAHGSIMAIAFATHRRHQCMVRRIFW